MPNKNNAVRGVKVLVLGLEDTVATELGGVLSAQNRTVHTEDFTTAADSLRIIDRIQPDVVFCSAKWGHSKTLLEELRSAQRTLPLVAVSRHPEVNEWLDAMEYGAADYCAAPFEANHLGWILENTLHYRLEPAVYRTKVA